MIPATPNSGTADSAPLVTIDDYQRITGDTSSSPTTFGEFLPEVLDELQRRMRRTFLYAQYTERLYLYRKGMVFGSATPYDASKGVVSPSGSPPENVGIFQGTGIWVGWFIPLPSLPVWQGVVDPQTDITYWGGFVGSTSTGTDQNGNLLVDQGFEIPAGLRRVICRVMWYCLNPATLEGMPGGVKAMSVGGVSVSGVLSSLVDTDPALCRDIKRFRKPQARAWDAQVTTIQ